MKVTITNTGRAAQGVNTASGKRAWIDPGKTRTVEMDEAGLAQASRHAHLTIEGDTAAVDARAFHEDDATATDAPGLREPSFGEMTDDELRDAVEKLDGKKPHPATKRETLIAKLKGE